MKIILATDLYLPVYNGVAQFSQNLAIALSERDNDVLVIAPSPTGKKYQEKENGYTVARVTSVPLPFFPGHRMSVSPSLEARRLFEQFKPDIVHIQTPLGIGSAVRTVARRKNIPVVATNHAMPENIIENLRLLAPVAKQAEYIIKEYGGWFYSKDRLDYITMPTQAAVDMFRRQAKETYAPIEAVSCGINLSRFKPGKVDPETLQKFGVPKGKEVILYAGRHDSEKHLSVLLDAVHIIHKKRPVHLVMSGTGNDEESLREHAKKLHMSGYVSFLGRVSDEDLPKVYKLGTVFVMPSPAELQSIVTMEAMSTGLPVVVVDAGAVHELCEDGHNGYICKTDNPADMADKIVAVLSSKKRKDMGKASLEIIKTHDIRQTSEIFENIYKKVIKSQKPRRPKLLARIFA